jgi:hypothetical protein
VIISNSIEWLSLDDWQANAVRCWDDRKWRKDWESRDTEPYLAALLQASRRTARTYAPGSSRSAGQCQQGLDQGRPPATSACSATRARKTVVVTFEQDYRSNNLSNQMKKRQYWIKEGGRWKIAYEGAA